MKRLAMTLALLSVTSFVAYGQPQETKPAAPSNTSVDEVLRNAFLNPSDPATFDLLKNSLPRAGDYFVVEGDLLMSEARLHQYVEENSSPTTDKSETKNRSIELIVNLLPDGGLDYYRDPKTRTLTYSIDRKSFPTPSQYGALVKNMPRATNDWELACPQCLIKFVYRKEFDESASTDKVNFVVRYSDVQGAYIAASFFPHDPPLRRYLNIDPSYFTPQGFDQVGVLRHELGHVLGYRHEHIQGIAGCRREGTDWQPLTPYDSKSVMHYFCGGKGSLRLELTELDKVGHQKLYGTPTKSSEFDRIPVTTSLVVRFEGGKVSDNVADVLFVLQKYHSLPTSEKRVARGDTVASIFRNYINLPGDPQSIGEVANILNGRRITDHFLMEDDVVVVPNVTLTTYPFSLTLDALSPKENSKLKNVRENWKYLEINEEAITNTRTRINYNGYELRINLKDDPDALKNASSALSEIESWQRAEVFPLLEAPSQASPPLYSIHTDDFLQQYRQAKEVDIGVEARIGELIGLPVQYTCDNGSSGLKESIVLIDQPIYHHPDLGSVVDSFAGPTLPSPIERDKNKFATVSGSFDAKTDHGTHLAGIVGSQENGFGLIGLAPDINIISLNWPDLQGAPGQLADRITKLDSSGGNPVFLFASSWDNPTYTGAKLLRSRLDGTKPLWVSAAGESLDGSDGIDIDNSNFRLGPLNLGNKYYMIVVTACEKCLSNSPRLMRFANYSSREFVHVAAPGDGIPSTISSGGYDRGSGTSQAAALVAGLAASMIKCWPNFYFRQPERVKFRLQLTSSPKLDDADFGKLKAGIVDGRAAILDPESNWQLTVADGIEEKYKKFNPVKWCKDNLILYDPITNLQIPSIGTAAIRRIVKRDDSWVVFGISVQSDWERRGEIVRIGPGTLQSMELNRPLLKTAENDTIMLSQVKDIILSGDLPYGDCK